jgi:ketosteroid isomerase-like protein
MAQMSNIEIARTYLSAIETGETEEFLARFVSPEIEHQEFPNRLNSRGAVSGLRAMKAAAERGRKVIASQRYEVRNIVEEGDRLALEVDWTGILAIPFESIPVGGTMRAHFAMFLDLKDGRIVRQRNYDCFEPW